MAERKDLWRISMRELAGLVPGSETARRAFKDRAELLYNDVALRALKDGETDDAAFAQANRLVGRNVTERLAKAAAGDLD